MEEELSKKFEDYCEYGVDKEIGGMIVNDKCKILTKKVKEIIDAKSSFSDWLNN